MRSISDLIVIQLVFHAATLAVMCSLWSLYPTFRDLIRESLYVVTTLYVPLVRYFQRGVGVSVANDRVYPDILMILGDILCFIACWIRVCWLWKSMLSMHLEISSLISLVIKFVITGNHPAYHSALDGRPAAELRVTAPLSSILIIIVLYLFPLGWIFAFMALSQILDFFHL